MSIRRRRVRELTEEKKTSHERWLVSYADFVTLLFAFFVVMYSVSQVNEDKYRSLAETLNSTFTQPTEQAAEPLNNSSDKLLGLNELADEFSERVAAYSVMGSVQLSANENWVELTLDAASLFASGRSEQSTQAKAIFSDLALMLGDYHNEIQVAGHTDDVPINNATYSSNWALSSARALSIVNYFAFQGIDPQRMSAVAFGEYRPIADNRTVQGRQQNRRVVIRVAKHAAKPLVETPEHVEITLEGREATLPTELSSPTLSTPLPAVNSIQPVRLKGGDLLFTSDPDLPRPREIETQLEPTEATP